jgi:hypothetical protein
MADLGWDAGVAFDVPAGVTSGRMPSTNRVCTLHVLVSFCKCAENYSPCKALSVGSKQSIAGAT